MILQGLRSAEPPAAPDAGGEGPGAGGERRLAGAAVRDGERGEPDGLLVGLRRASGRGGQQGGPELRVAAGAGAPAVQRGRAAGGGVRRELHHDVGRPEVQSAAAEIGEGPNY